MTKYLLSSPKFTGELEFRFKFGNLNLFENRSGISDAHIKGLFAKFPFSEESLIQLCTDGKGLTLVKSSVQVLFKDFWNAYNYKVGNKARAEKLWNALTDTERLLIMDHLPLYEAYLAKRPRMEKMYAETYLNQRRWESEFPKN